VKFLHLPPSLKYRRFRYLWLGMMISVAGNQMQTTAVLWHVNEISGEPIALGIVGLVRIIPILLFSLIAGTVADVLNRRRLMFLTQSTLALLAGLLGLLTFLGLDSLLVIYSFLAVSAAVWSFDLPARQSLIPNLVPNENLTNAFSLSSISFQTGAILGPALAGIVLANWGIAYAYVLNAISFSAVLIALMLMGSVPQETKLIQLRSILLFKNNPLVISIREGLRYVFNQPIILSSMLLDFFATFFSNAITLLPIFAKDILGVGAQGYGLLASAPSIGAAAIGIILAFAKNIRNQGKILLVAVVGYGFATILFGVSTTFYLTFFALVMTGFTDGLSAIIRNTIRQLQTPDQLRGRMVSINQIFFMGGPQLGELEAGVVAQIFGPTLSVISGGIGCILAVGWIARKFPQLRRYRGDEPVLAGGM
jgi:MFS family permease